MKKVHFFLLLFTISKSYCAEQQAPNRQTLIHKYQEFIQIAQRCEQDRPKNTIIEAFLKGNFEKIVKQATSELERLTTKKNLTAEELVESHKLLKGLWS